MGKGWERFAALEAEPKPCPRGAAMNSFNKHDFANGWIIPETCASAKHIREALAIIDAINAGELLAALPASANERHRHQTAVSLLGIVERTLRDALNAGPAVGQPCHAAINDTLSEQDA
ncbi:MAG: hypothetical protein KGL56_00710 [Alphaproteobacteria bacterium]|nr:hypothetical protein [Alphaproteobacteria bacterium]